jgi:uncharacterized protein (DUF1501 family)
MNRRDFVKYAFASGLTIPTWGLVPASAQSAGYTGRILVNVFAQGGLDQSSWADPRETDKTINTWVGTPAGVAGNIRYAPIGSNAAFFAKYYQHMMVINGVQLETNGHDTGTTVGRTGTLAMGYPDLTELFASVNGKGLPFAAMGSCGPTVGLRACSPIPDANTFHSIVAPNSQSDTTDFIKQGDLDKINAARAARMTAVTTRATELPRRQQVAGQFVAAAQSRTLLSRVASITPAMIDTTFPSAHVALLAAQAGIAATVEVASGNFDAHSNIANTYAQSLPALTNMVDFIWQKAADLGIDNRLFVRIFSDLGREPLINAGQGKDHWPVNTMILMEKNAPWANRVFGASGPKHEQLMINLTTGAVDPNGVVIKSRHIHNQLRSYLGVQTADPRFDLKVPSNEVFSFFDPNAKTGYPNV